MEELKQPCKVISIYSSITTHGKTGYAINLTAALARVTSTRTLFINIGLSCNSAIASEAGIDVLSLRHIKKQYLEEKRDDYQYIIINLPVEIGESIYEIFSYSDVIHFFIGSSKDSLKNGYVFLEAMLKRALEDVHSKVRIVVNRLNIFDKFSIEEMSWLLRRDVWAIVPEEGILDALIDSKGMPIVLKSENSPYSKVIIRIAKSESDKLLGLALGSGAAFGLAHIGVLRTLEQNHVSIDILSGSSIGALIAALWGLGFSSDKIEHIAKRLRNKLNIVKLLDFTIPISGILAGKRLRRFLRSILGEKTFEDLQIPVKIMVYDLANRESLAIEKGPLVEAVYMSISVPGIFEPKMEKGRMIIDGGISDPVPVDILLKQGVKKIIAVNVLPGPEDIHIRNMLLKEKIKEEENLIRTGPFCVKLSVIMKNFFRRIFTPNIFDVIMSSMQSTEYVLAKNSCEKADIVLHPVFPDATSVDFHLVKRFIKTGEEEAASYIQKIRELALR